jgi:hypothetical protein
LERPRLGGAASFDGHPKDSVDYRERPATRRHLVRRLLLGAVVGAVVLATAAIAIAATKTTFRDRFTSNRTAHAVGTRLAFTSVDPANTAKNGQPRRARELDITFPKGTKIDYTVRAVCGSFDAAATAPCPSNTRIGSGSAELRIEARKSPSIPAGVTAYNRRKGLWLFVTPKVSNLDPILIKAHFRGRTLVVPIPKRCVDYDCARNGDARFTRFKLATRTFNRGKSTYIRTPGTCPSAGWKFVGTFKFETGSNQVRTSTQTCRK